MLAGSPCHPPHAIPATRPLRASIAARPVLLPPLQARTRRAPTALRSTRARAVVAPPSASRRAAGAHAERRPGLRPGAISAAAPAQPDRARSWADHGRIGARATAGTIVRAGGGRSCRGSWRCSPRAAAWPHPPGWVGMRVRVGVRIRVRVRVRAGVQKGKPPGLGVRGSPSSYP